MRGHLTLGRRLVTATIWAWGLWLGAGWFFVGFSLRWIWIAVVFGFGGYAFLTNARNTPAKLTLIKKIGWNSLFLLGVARVGSSITTTLHNGIFTILKW